MAESNVTIGIRVTPKLKEACDQVVEDGLYLSVSELARDAIRKRIVELDGNQ